MKKKKMLKILLIVSNIVIISVFAFIYVLPKMYLAHKYDTKISDYKIANYSPAYFWYDLASGFELQRSLLLYEYKENGRQFEVKYLNLRLYDSYQLEDVKKWLVEELSEIIDENIDYISVSPSAVYGIYNYEKGTYTNTVWTEENVKLILKNIDKPNIYIHCTDFEKYLLNPYDLKRYNYNNINNYCIGYVDSINKKLNMEYSISHAIFYIHKYQLVLSKSKYYYYKDVDFGYNDNNSESNRKLYVIKRMG